MTAGARLTTKSTNDNPLPRRIGPQHRLTIQSQTCKSCRSPVRCLLYDVVGEKQRRFYAGAILPRRLRSWVSSDLVSKKQWKHTIEPCLPSRHLKLVRAGLRLLLRRAYSVTLVISCDAELLSSLKLDQSQYVVEGVSVCSG